MKKKKLKKKVKKLEKQLRKLAEIEACFITFGNLTVHEKEIKDNILKRYL
jgi:hypothetical protein